MVAHDQILKNFRNLYHQLDKASKYQGADPIFKMTTNGSQALLELKIPSSEREFKDVVENLYILIYEGSGDGKRLPLKLDKKRTSYKLKQLRNHFIHDQEHGTPSEIRKKYKQIGDIYQELIGTRAPYKAEHWNYITIELLRRLNLFISHIIEKYPDLSDFYIDSSDEMIRRHFEHDITLFPDERVKYRTIKKSEDFHKLAAAPIFIPHFSWSSPPSFGPLDAAIHFSSKAYMANLENYEKFLKHVEKLWLKRLYYITRDTRDLFSWSISSEGKLIYGSGVPNLIEAIKNTDIGIVTIFLIGTYGEDYSKTFFIIISNYWKGRFFRDNYLDLYLSNMPLDFKWVEEINESVKLLSTNSEPAESYSLKSYIRHIWRSKKRYKIKDKLIGGIGRECIDDEREWDQFSGLILFNPFNEEDFELDHELSFNINTQFDRCPVNAFDEIVMSITNPPPSVDEIKSGEFIGFVNPTISHFIFDGYGHTIHALLFWGWSIARAK